MSESYTVKEMGSWFNVMKDANMLSCDCIATCLCKGYAELICKSLNANSGDAIQESPEERDLVTISRECALVAQIALDHARDEQTADVDGAYYDEIEQALEKEQ